MTSKNNNDTIIKNVKDFYTRVAIQDQPDQWGIQITQGPYTGLVYKYGAVSLKKAKVLKRNTIKYEYEILYVPPHLRNLELSEEDEKQFHNFLGDVLVSLLNEYYQNKK